VMSKKAGTADEWYVWTVRSGKFEIVERFIEEKIPQVSKILYPTISTEKTTRKGIKVKKSPLYAGYLFLQYTHDQSNPATWVKINSHPFITGYVGPCTAQDLASVNSLQKVDKLNDEKINDFLVGDLVSVKNGVFVGFRGEVVLLSSNSVTVDLERADRVLQVVFSPEDLGVITRQ